LLIVINFFIISRNPFHFFIFFVPPPKLLLQCPNAGLFKQWLAIFYDSLLIIAILLAATAILLPFNHGEAVSGPAYTLYLLGLIFFYYGWFWHRAGQTLGMKTWKIRVINEYGRNPGWGESLLRWLFALLSAACFGLGYFWRLFTPCTWHDRLSHTRVIDISRCASDDQ